MYFFGNWQHYRYWNGTIVRVNKIEAEVYSKLLTVDINDIYAQKDFSKLKEIFKPLDGKLLIRLIDQKGNIAFESATYRHHLGRILQQSRVKSGVEEYTIQIISYSPPSWNSVYGSWFSNVSEWFTIKYDRITTPTIFYFLIWSLFFTALIWRYKSRIDNERLFHVLREFQVNKNEKKLE